jgi:hypothetical protein
MNLSINASVSQEYHTLDYITTKFGSTWELNNLNFYPFIVLGSIGFILSFFSFVIFLNDEFHNQLCKYLRIYALSNSIMCFTSIFNFVPTSFRLLTWSNSEQAQIFLNYIFIPLTNFSYFCGSLLDIIILIDRITILIPRLKNFVKLSAVHVCSIAFIICVLIDMPFFFMHQPNSIMFTLSGNTTSTIWFSDTSQFGASQIGKTVYTIVIILRDGVVVGMQIILNLICTLLFRRIIRKKISTSVAMSAGQVSIIRTPHTDLMQIGTINASNLRSTRRRKKVITLAEKNNTRMVIYMVILSIVEHLLVLLCVFYPNSSLISYELHAVNKIFQVLKRVLDVVAFFVYNLIFRKVFLKYLKLGN